MVKEANPLELTHPQEVSAIIAIASGVMLALSTLALAIVDTSRFLGYMATARERNPDPAILRRGSDARRQLPWRLRPRYRRMAAAK
jgi:hypothetical protein